MDQLPPTPETSVSPFVWACSALTFLIVVVTLLVVRRRRQRLLSLALGMVSMLVLGAGVLYLIIPPSVPTPGQPRTLTRCPYDRLVWSNMRADVAEPWQPCRRVARVQLASSLMGTSLLTVAMAALALRRGRPRPVAAELPRRAAPG